MRLILFCFLFLFTKSSIGIELNNLKTPKSFKSNFTQTRFIVASDLTLESSGIIEVIESKTLRWEQEQPFPYLILMREGEIEAGTKDSLKKVKEPVTKHMAKLMFSLFQGKMTGVNEIFNVKKIGSSLVLTPKDETMKKFMNRVTVEGGDFVESIKLEETSGNWLVIKFSELKKI